MTLPTHQGDFISELLKRNFGKEISNTLNNNYSLIKGSSGSAITLLVAELFLIHKRTMLFVLDDVEAALFANTELENFLGKDHVLYFPASLLEPYQIEKIQNANLVLRTEVLKNINHLSSPKVIVTNALALSEKILKKEDFKAISLSIATGTHLDFDISETLTEKYNFQKTDFVSEPGEFSLRGGILDIFSYSNEEPYRISLFGSEVESIKTFDIETQLSNKKVESFELISNMSFSVSGKKISFFELLPKDTIVFSKLGFLIQKKIEEYFEKAKVVYDTLSKTISHQTPDELFINNEELLAGFKNFHTLDFSTQKISGIEGEIQALTLHQTPQPSFNKNFELLANDLKEKKEQGFDTWISFSSEKQKDRLKQIFDDSGHQVFFKSFLSELHEGFVDEEQKISVYTDHQIFDRYQRFVPKNTFAKSEQLTIKDLMLLKVGDYIAHIDFGIGKFMGLVKVNNGGKIQECFKLVYKNGELLYVSIRTLHKISKYTAPEGKEVQLSKLGSPSWKNLKQRTKTKVKQLAFDLIKLYAKRKTAKGFAYSPDSYLQTELEASFMYEDTPDQEKATLDVKKDMEADTVMDRLICGDVGFGKTEVAIRAAFKAATDGKQVAILVPTTVLAFQHYRSFTERLKDFPVTIAYLNRFRSAKQKSETIEGLKTGKVDIVIGTHQLVGSKIKFKNLGLLIIDEEHKFGVSVKDKLKTFKANVDTLTLTATPIPRTLQFSLMAARDLSVIKTPPPNRQPVETQIIGFNEEIIRDAVSYEVQRGGQVFFINNRIENLKEIAGFIQRLVPEARIITGHGQMEGKQLEENVVAFMEGKYDVLVSTTIVESGVDVPNANTIFINDAQRFGMADLHQMRGRVGRSNRKAFCFLITPPFDLMTSEARKRLEAISQFSDLGSGFQIAMKDLEIRGAGDLLGAEQSGFINEMGFETYQKLIQEALEELKDDAEFEKLFENEEDRKRLFNSNKDVNIDTDFELLLPDDFVSSTEERLLLYQKLAEIDNKNDLAIFIHDLEDRFGKLPKEAVELMKSIELKWLATEIGFHKLVIKNKIFLGYFPTNPQDKFYLSEKFKRILNFLSRFPKEAFLKEKNNQLLLRKENVTTIDEVNEVLQKIISLSLEESS